MFTLTSDIEESASRSEEISMDYDFFHSDILTGVTCGNDYTVRIVPKGYQHLDRAAFSRRCGRLFHPLFSGCGQPDLLGESGGIPLEAKRHVHVVAGAGRFKALGVASKTDLN